VASGQKQDQNKGLGTEQAQPHAIAALGAGEGKSQAEKLRLLQASRAPQDKKGPVATEEGRGRKAGGQQAKRRGLKPRRPSKGEDWPGQAASDGAF
jgi:hypothetical protein